VNIAKFRRGDGVVHEAEEGSESFKLMSKDGSFERVNVDPASEKQTEPNGSHPGDKTPVDLTKLGKKELLELATKAKIPAADKMNKAELIAAIEAAAAKTTAE
jgi:hypothetical protein